MTDIYTYLTSRPGWYQISVHIHKTSSAYGPKVTVLSRDVKLEYKNLKPKNPRNLKINNEKKKQKSRTKKSKPQDFRLSTPKEAPGNFALTLLSRDMVSAWVWVLRSCSQT